MMNTLKMNIPKGIFNKDYENEVEIKNCEIKINNELIPFNYFHYLKIKVNIK